MNKFFIFISIFLSLPSLLLAVNNYQPQTETIGFYLSAPPAFFYVTNAQGKRAGADPMLPFSSVGQQGDGLHGLEEISNSVVAQENIKNDITGQPSKHTHWSVRIADGGKQTYKVNIVGLATGQGNLDIRTHLVKSSRPGQKTSIKYLVTSNFSKQFIVNYVPVSSTFSVVPIVGNGGLVMDVMSACQLNLITSVKICERLKKKAGMIQEALDSKNFEKAEGLTNSFLANLGVGHLDGDDDGDCHVSIKEPALSILIDDAKALTVQIEKQEKSKKTKLTRR